MNQEFLTNLPSEIIIDILSRLPVRTIISCKGVCKSWNKLLESQEFAKSQVSKSLPGLVVFADEMRTNSLKIFEFVDELDLESHELHYDLVTKFDLRKLFNLPNASIGIEGSVNGLLFFRVINTEPNALYISNPITREYIEIFSPEKRTYCYPAIVTYGFGVSKASNQHKVVRIFHDCILDPSSTTYKLLEIANPECQVYTIGTGSWRSIAPGAPLQYNCRSFGAFLNGKLHWLVLDLKDSHQISCLDLENELFSTFSPPNPLPERARFLGGLVILGDCLCLCDNTSNDEIVIWQMKDGGVEKSWTKKFVISKLPDLAGESYEVVLPLKVFKDGDILMTWEDFYLFYYSNKSKSVHPKIDMFELQSPGCIHSLVHRSSFVSLRSFGLENVRSF